MVPCISWSFPRRYPHDEVIRLSCTEARNYYSGVVSVIPITLDLISLVISDLVQASNETDSQTDFTASQNATAKPEASGRSFKPAGKRADEWKPVWKPPGRSGKWSLISNGLNSL